MQRKTKIRSIAEMGIVLLSVSVPTHAAPTFAVEEKSLGVSAGYDSIRGVATSTDGNHVVFLGVKGKQQFVVLDGNPGPAFEWIIPESVAYNDGHIGYLIQTSTETQPVIDGQVGKGFYTVSRNHIFWSPDDKRIAIGAHFQDGGAAVAVDGITGTKFDAVDDPLFSPDSKRLAYVARRGKQVMVVIDGQEQKPYDAVTRLGFSPNSKFFSYEAVVNGKCLLVMVVQAGKASAATQTGLSDTSVVWKTMEGKAYDAVLMGPAFSNDGARLVAVVMQGGKLVVVINGEESEPYEKMVAGDFVLSPDGKHMAYAVKKGEKQMAIIDNVARAPFDHIVANAMSFSPDSKHVAYVAGATPGGPDFVVLDGVQQKAWEGILVGTPFFSPDSKRLAYGAKHDNKWHFVIDEVEGKAYEFIEPPSFQIFSPDSRRVAYRAANGKNPVVVLDGVESSPAEYVGPVSFSPDSRHAAYLHIRDGKTYMVIDATEAAGPYPAAAPETRVFFDDSATVHFIALKKDEFIRVKVTIDGVHPKPEIQNPK